MTWKIAKQFDFCYGHRVHNQSLNQEYSIDNRCVCRHLHGHQGTILVYLESDVLINGMVTDFKHLNWFKKFIDDVLDHKFIIDRKDPLFNSIIPNGEHLPWVKKPEGYSIIDPNYFKMLDNEALIEILEGFVVVDFVPTSEHFSRWLFEVVKVKMDKIGIGIKTSAVQFFETPKSQSTFTHIGE